MAAVTTDQIKELREMTGAGMMDCKRTLEETGGDIKKAADALRSKGLAKAAKRMDRTTGVGRIFSYIHGEGNIGVLLQLNCETDFVARNEDFAQLGKDICMQIAAQAPLAVTAEEIPEEEVEREKQVVEAQLKEEGKKPEQIEKIVPGKMKKFYSEVALLEQPYIKDPKTTIQDLVKEAISKFGENITVGRFTRYQVG
ncbi:MAG: translation elongation factor Ts [Spirochaetaceae bacterium]|nr:translation elongation factor Ts [Spirochaetaceae bacterium]|tara:strand:- start:201202 stop:201795 length:594 start_codon:yes stop_codon:yes gene_type:complete